MTIVRRAGANPAAGAVGLVGPGDLWHVARSMGATMMNPPPSGWELRVARLVAVGIVGPRTLSGEAETWTRAELERLLAEATAGATTRRILVSLASPLEHRIATHAQEDGFELDAIVPSENFAATFEDPAARATFTSLLAGATDRTTLTYREPSDAALAGAATYILHYADVVLVILDEDESVRPDRGAGIVEEAQVHRRRLVVIDPRERAVSRPV